MKVIIAGGRTISGVFALLAINEAVEKSGFEITELISGGCRGIDQVGENWGRVKRIPVLIIKPEWSKYGSKAGPMRNEKMAQKADALIAIWDGQSRGTADMIRRARAHGLKVHIKTVKITNYDSSHLNPCRSYSPPVPVDVSDSNSKPNGTD